MTYNEFKQKAASKLIDTKSYCLYGEGKHKNCLCIDKEKDGKISVYYKFGISTYDEMYFETEDAALEEAFRRLTIDTKRARQLRSRKNTITALTCIVIAAALIVLAMYIPIKPAISVDFSDFSDGFYIYGDDSQTRIICQFGIDYHGPKWYVCTQNGKFVETVIVEGSYPTTFGYDILMHVNPENQYCFTGYFNGTKTGSDGTTYRVFHVENWSPVFPVARNIDILTNAGITIYDMLFSETIKGHN
ncbi:MAG: hypothetical protein E7491_04415 [Ruminococcaceae bacterium]|nr:hypothetical protein [Oscillospiraceae bacterium]